MLKTIALSFIILAVLVFNALRFWKLDTIPYGYHWDEVGSAVTVECFAESGCDAEMRPWPLFGRMEYGQDKPPTYVYPALVWAKLFGSTVPSLRAYSVFVLLIGILGLFFLGKEIFGVTFGLVVVLAATCSPWAWVMNRVALESFVAPVLAIWGLYFFWRSRSWWDWAIAGFLFALSMYSYPPAALQIPLMMVTLGIYESRRRPINWRSALALSTVFVVSLLPLVYGYFHTRLSDRFKDIGIFNPDYLHSLGKTGTPWDFICIFVHNYLLHLSPDFLFLTGDPSYVHSTRHLGLFSGLDITALGFLLVFLFLAFRGGGRERNPVIKNRGWLLFLAANFFIGIIPSALTFQELPHALRICGSWPFMMLFTGFMWWSAAEALKALWPAIAIVGILSSSVLAYQYFMIYPQESKGMFDYWVKDIAEQLKTEQDWQQFMVLFHHRNYHIRYYLVHKLGLSCKQADDLWLQLYYNLKKKKMW